MVRVLAPTLLALAIASPSTAQDEYGLSPCSDIAALETPKQVVEALYEQTPALPQRCLRLTQSLAAEFAADEVRSEVHDDPIGRLGFDWVVNGQDYLITNVRVRMSEVFAPGPDDPKRQVVTAYFDNFGSPQVIDYYFVIEDEGWALEEAVSRGEGMQWVLSLLLRYGFYGGDPSEQEMEKD